MLSTCYVLLALSVLNILGGKLCKNNIKDVAQTPICHMKLVKIQQIKMIVIVGAGVVAKTVWAQTLKLQYFEHITGHYSY